MMFSVTFFRSFLLNMLFPQVLWSRVWSRQITVAMDDMISNLPDDVLCHILSFLPIEDVFATSFVSKRWRPLWLSVTNLDFDQDRFTRSGNRSFSSFIKFVEASILRLGIHQPIKTFRLKCSTCSVSHVKTWLKTAADRKVENLQINCLAFCQDLPCSIFSITTLVVLQLKCVAFKGFFSVELPLLKTLHLDHVTFLKSQHFADLLNGCPLLENLEAKIISSAYDPSSESETKFTTLPKLVRADAFTVWIGFGIPVRTFCNVEFLRIDRFCDVDIPIFPNLIRLDLIFEVGVYSKWESVLDMLNHCPQLQILVLENQYAWPNTHVRECFSSQLRRCILKKFSGMKSQMRFAELVMQNSTLLHTMKIFSNPFLSHEKILEMKKELDSCTWSSISCEILFM
ncbi:F-box/FBD/LRR-repeat protein At5g56420-like [Lotus japonicus]|uniref:F-box/FBD/LRR-repeat protein At5g56420-like n=1 Tax=Lotus japonicus TaxID=34305 RepID=UPI00258EEFE6|nr:F-box/FBD/LRR-repeat protein At5g56420-like [Lotus japonicus]